MGKVPSNLTEALTNSRNPFIRSPARHSAPINKLDPLITQIKDIFITGGTLERLEWSPGHQAFILPKTQLLNRCFLQLFHLSVH
jgi:hypothetical protein